ncbi:unnamed protein product, partial [Rotaria magnacalcarata]
NRMITILLFTKVLCYALISEENNELNDPDSSLPTGLSPNCPIAATSASSNIFNSMS